MEHVIFVLSLALLFSLWFLYFINRENKDLKKEKKEQKNKLINLQKNGALDSVLDVDRFNDWWNDEGKDDSFYANPGIFLRTDKLSLGHINDYLLDKFGLDDEDFGHNKKYDFQMRIRKDWMDKKSEGYLISEQ